LLDQAQLAHDDQRQIREARLLHDPHLTRFLGARGRDGGGERERHCEQLRTGHRDLGTTETVCTTHAREADHPLPTSRMSRANEAAMIAVPVIDLALIGGNLHPGPGEEVRAGTVLVGDDVIVAAGDLQAPSGVLRIDCSGCAVTAGLWNSHVHFFERMWAGAEAIPPTELDRQLRDAFTAYGFTSVFDTGSMWANTRCIRDRIESGEVPGPRIRSTGE